jgi:hypothetical protein
MPFTNNLRKGDPVLDKHSNRKGVVQMDPRATSLRVAVLFEGNTAQRYVPVGDLRLLNAKGGEPIEDVPPVDGELPPAATQEPRTPTLPRAQTEEARAYLLQAAVNNIIATAGRDRAGADEVFMALAAALPNTNEGERRVLLDLTDALLYHARS